MSLLPSLEEIREELNPKPKAIPLPEGKVTIDWDLLVTNQCPLCGGPLRSANKWLLCYKPTEHTKVFRINKKKARGIQKSFIRKYELSPAVDSLR